MQLIMGSVKGLLPARGSKTVNLEAEVSLHPVHYTICVTVLMHVLQTIPSSPGQPLVLP